MPESAVNFLHPPGRFGSIVSARLDSPPRLRFTFLLDE
jgi:hypothetical protein